LLAAPVTLPLGLLLLLRLPGLTLLSLLVLALLMLRPGRLLAWLLGNRLGRRLLLRGFVWGLGLEHACSVLWVR
jgi:hypothetical protein